MVTDGNFPAVLQVAAFLGAAMLGGVLMLASLYGIARRKAWTRKTVAALVVGAGMYFLVLYGFSAFSRERSLAVGQEKYFCEIDCHLAYSVTNTAWTGEAAARVVIVTLKTRFDEKTISAHRPADAALTPNPRELTLLDGEGRHYAPEGIEGTSLETSLVPGQSYGTKVAFRVPPGVTGLRLLITSAAGPQKLLIGNEMSLGHKKTYLNL